ncbi:hypothetical protein Pcinc_037229 [Petrolisthes cinctipes]|uniref:Uncharacterized protein n=1 Tax=Petrolisthes cinctipes TaxID=88211 RepID=A0AAE1BWD9_PETCI|nr:hypothetical protein Pcinc_037229 [Petrolisthes cinctipes]
MEWLTKVKVASLTILLIVCDSLGDVQNCLSLTLPQRPADPILLHSTLDLNHTATAKLKVEVDIQKVQAMQQDGWSAIDFIYYQGETKVGWMHIRLSGKGTVRIACAKELKSKIVDSNWSTPLPKLSAIPLSIILQTEESQLSVMENVRGMTYLVANHICPTPFSSIRNMTVKAWCSYGVCSQIRQCWNDRLLQEPLTQPSVSRTEPPLSGTHPPKVLNLLTQWTLSAALIGPMLIVVCGMMIALCCHLQCCKQAGSSHQDPQPDGEADSTYEDINSYWMKSLASSTSTSVTFSPSTITIL